MTSVTRKNRYPLPLINNVIHWLKDMHYFTKLDIHWGTIMSPSMKVTSGRPHSALFEPLVTCFGLTNCPATFQMMMNKIFQDLITEGIISVYLNNILIPTNSLEEHCWITRLVLDLS
jgi:hypothetical protein